MTGRLDQLAVPVLHQVDVDVSTKLLQATEVGQVVRDLMDDVQRLSLALDTAKRLLREGDEEVAKLRGIADAKEDALRELRLGLVDIAQGRTDSDVANWSTSILITRIKRMLAVAAHTIAVLDDRAKSAEAVGSAMSPLEIRYVIRHSDEFDGPRPPDAPPDPAAAQS